MDTVGSTRGLRLARTEGSRLGKQWEVDQQLGSLRQACPACFTPLQRLPATMHSSFWLLLRRQALTGLVLSTCGVRFAVSACTLQLPRCSVPSALSSLCRSRRSRRTGRPPLELRRADVTAWPYPEYHQLSIHTEAARRLIQRSVTDVRIVR